MNLLIGAIYQEASMSRIQTKTGWLVCKACGRRITFNCDGNTVVLRTVTELQSPGEINYSKPNRSLYDFTLFQGWLNFFSKEKKADEYPEEYLNRERNGRDEPTVFINILSHIAGTYREL